MSQCGNGWWRCGDLPMGYLSHCDAWWQNNVNDLARNPERLLADSIELPCDREDIPSEPGIYVFFLEGKISYIGISTNVNLRLWQHERERRLSYDRVTVIAPIMSEWLEEIEAIYIAHFKPPENRKFPYFHSEAAGLKSLLEHA